MRVRDLVWSKNPGNSGPRSQRIFHPNSPFGFVVWDNNDGTYDLMATGTHNGDVERLSRLELAALIAPLTEAPPHDRR